MQNQAEIIIKMKQCLKEMEIANAYPDEKSAKWVKHLAAVMELECLKLRKLNKEQ